MDLVLPKNIADTFIQPESTSNSPRLESELGEKSTELLEWLESRIAQFKQCFSEISLKKLGGLGWQDITVNEAGEEELCKFDFGKEIYQLDPVVEENAIKSGRIVFTGARLCGYSTYVAAHAVARKYPEAQMYWLKVSADMTERTNSNLIGKDHQVLEVTFPNEQPITVDLTYAQVKREKQLLVASTSALDKIYRAPIKNAIHADRVPIHRAIEVFDKELDSESAITTTDLEALVETLLLDSNSPKSSIITSQGDNMPETIKVSTPLPVLPETEPVVTPETPTTPATIPSAPKEIPALPDPAKDPAALPLEPVLPEKPISPVEPPFRSPLTPRD